MSIYIPKQKNLFVGCASIIAGVKNDGVGRAFVKSGEEKGNEKVTSDEDCQIKERPAQSSPFNSKFQLFLFVLPQI